MSNAAGILDPLTPQDCDLRDFSFMPLDVVRLRDSTLAIKATGEEFRAAVCCASLIFAASRPDLSRSGETKASRTRGRNSFARRGRRHSSGWRGRPQRERLRQKRRRLRPERRT